MSETGLPTQACRTMLWTMKVAAPRSFVLLLLVTLQGSTPATMAQEPPSGATRSVTSVSPDGSELLSAFGRLSQANRLLVILSPSSGVAAPRIQEALSGLERPDLRVLVVWTPFVPTDSLRAAVRSTARLADRRVTHFWDPSGFASRSYQSRSRQPGSDVLLAFRPSIEWFDLMPDPDLTLSIGDTLPAELSAGLANLSGQ